jgi:hypothetical protein
MPKQPLPKHIDRKDSDALADWVASDDFDPGDEFVDAAPLRRIVAAQEALDQARRQLDDDVRAAHQAGMSWTVIGAVLGTSRQAARQRFATPAHT